LCFRCAQIQSGEEHFDRDGGAVPRAAGQGAAAGQLRPLRQAAAAARKTAQSQDESSAQNEGPHLRRGLHFLRNQHEPTTGKENFTLSGSGAAKG